MEHVLELHLQKALGFVGGEGAIKDTNRFRHSSIILQKRLYLIKPQQSRAFRECIFLCMFDYSCYFSVYPLNIKAKTKFEAFIWNYFLKYIRNLWPSFRNILNVIFVISNLYKVIIMDANDNFL